MPPECPNCGERMALLDETTKLFEYRCESCFERRIEWKGED